MVFMYTENLHNKNNNDNNNKYMSRALNPSVSNLHEAQSAVRVQLKQQTTYLIKTEQPKKPVTSKTTTTTTK